MTIQLHNTLTRRKEPFVPLNPERVTVYVCGPTVYDYVHIGNGRPAVIFDQLVRLLRHDFGTSNVVYATNITDIDDKIMARAVEEGEDIAAVTERFSAAYLADVAALNVLAPDVQPRATGHLPEMIAMITGLMDKGHAYAAEGHVLFDVSSMADYGGLSRHSQDELEAGARVEVAPYKRNPADFVLWKPSQPDQPGWDSPWGRGRPGWHLECSAMIEQHLGQTIDIHGGGQDLIFPHHENEIAQSTCAHGAPLARTWLHNGYLLAGGQKMSKSLGNFATIHGLLEKWPGEVLRLALLGAQYRQPLDFTEAVLSEQKKRLDRWYRLADGVTAAADVPISVLDALRDDLNTPKALAALEALAKPDTMAHFVAGARFMGLLMGDADAWFKAGAGSGALEETTIEAKIAERLEAKKNKDFATADRIRDELAAAGIRLLDRPGGTDWERS